MKKEQLQKKVNEIKWFHQIELPCEEGGSIITPGEVGQGHCTEAMATLRFGLPQDLTGKTVLDIGANNGYFSFLAEKRGATVTALDPNQGGGGNIAGFLLAKEALGSGIELIEDDLEEFYTNKSFEPYDITLYYGVLYHVENPLSELRKLSALTKEMALIETAIGKGIEHEDQNLPIWHFMPGFDSDKTNIWYPSVEGLIQALTFVGFQKIEYVYITEGYERITVRAFK